MRLGTLLLIVVSLSLANVLLPVSCFIPTAPSKSSTILANFNRNRKKNIIVRTSNSAVSLRMAEVPLIDEWVIDFRGGISGSVISHSDPDIDDGDSITTSTLVTDQAHCKEGLTFVTISGSEYRLGSPKGKHRNLGLFNFFDKKDESKKLSGKTIGLRMAETPLIDDWAVTFRGCISGTVFNHPDPDLDDGVVITTSTLDTDKANCREGVTIVTTSGSEYRLGSSKNDINSFNKKIESKIKLSGKTIGNGKYVLVGKASESTSGKSQIWTAYRSSDPLSSSPEPIGPPLIAKITANLDSLSREHVNYERATSGFFQGCFVEKIDYLPQAGPDFEAHGALVIEQGAMDLKQMIAVLGDGVGLKGRGMRDAAVSVAQCIQAMHSSGMVWTDLKMENFVLVFGKSGKDGTNSESEGLPGVKGIDLESACPHKRNPIDFSPEACPPEFAKEFVKGLGEHFILDYSYDIWSFGMMMYELSTGSSYFQGKTPAEITSLLSDNFEVDVSAIEDKLLRDLVKSCLDTRPNKRPNINQIFLHSYFITTGIGPFDFISTGIGPFGF